MDLVERIALIVRPKRRFVEWANSVDHGGPKLSFEEARTSPTTYLVESIESMDDVSELIDAYAIELFEEELNNWMSDESTWPKNRTPHVFRDWFDVELSDLVLDTQDGPLVEDERGVLEELVYATVHHCAWCDREIGEDEERFGLAMAHASPAALEDLEGMAIPIPLSSRDRPVMGLVPGADSDARKAGKHVVFTLCSEACGEALRRAFERERGAYLS